MRMGFGSRVNYDGTVVDHFRAHGIPISKFEEIDSTSLLARRELTEGRVDRSRIFVAQRQTGGVGRLGRAWASPEGGLWMTLVWPLARAGKRFSPVKLMDALGLRLGRGVHRTVEWAFIRSGGRAAEVELKFPNDIMIRGRKVAGILTEVVHGSSRPFLLVGVGLNLNFEGSVLPHALSGRCATLLDLTGQTIDIDLARDRLVSDLCAEIETDESTASVVRSLHGRMFGVGMTVSVTDPTGKKTQGVFKGLSESGAAVYEVEGKLIEVTMPMGE